MDKLTVRDLDAHDKRVFVRVDFNVPLEDGRVTDDSRIRASLPTIRYLASQGARVVLASHLGRPDGKVQDGLRLRPVGQRLSQLMQRNVPVTGDALGPGTEDAIKRLRPGEVLLLENLRFHPEEEANDPKFASTLASYADVYVNDAFGTAHRAHASTVGVPSLLPAYAGLLMEREITALSKLLEEPERPFVAIVGGAKVSGKLKVLDNLVRKVDRLILGGGMANTFLLAQGRSVGKSLAEHDMVDQARRVLAEAEANGVRVILPVDVIVAKEVTRGTEYKTLLAEKIPASWHIVDVGRGTLAIIEEALVDARTVMWNGPIGVFEIPVFGAGTRHVARILAARAEAGATVVVGGGDSVAALQQQGLAAQMTHISTGGGASLEFLEGRELPGIAVLLDRPTEPKAEPLKAEALKAEPLKPKAEPLKAEPPKREPVAVASKPKAEPAPKARAAAAVTEVKPTSAGVTAKATPTRAKRAEPAPKPTAAKAPPAKAPAAKAPSAKAAPAKAPTAKPPSAKAPPAKATPAKATPAKGAPIKPKSATAAPKRKAAAATTARRPAAKAAASKATPKPKPRPAAQRSATKPKAAGPARKSGKSTSSPRPAKTAAKAKPTTAKAKSAAAKPRTLAKPKSSTTAKSKPMARKAKPTAPRSSRPARKAPVRTKPKAPRARRSR